MKKIIAFITVVLLNITTPVMAIGVVSVSHVSVHVSPPPPSPPHITSTRSTLITPVRSKPTNAYVVPTIISNNNTSMILLNTSHRSCSDAEKKKGKCN